MINVNLVGFKQFTDTVNKLPITLRKEVSTSVRAAADRFRGEAIKAAPADVGFLRSQITVKPIDELKYEVVSGSSYSAYMEFGTKSKFKAIPGIDASEFKGKGTGDYYDFLNNILNWVKRKGLHTEGLQQSFGSDQERFLSLTERNKARKKRGLKRITKDKSLERTAAAIAYFIMKHGVKPHPFFFKQIPIVRRDAFRNIRNILNQL